MLNTIKKFLVLIIILGFLTAGIDYLRMNSGEVPIFNMSSYNQTSKIQKYRGLFYIGEREVKASSNEPLVDSDNISFKILFFDLNVPRRFKEKELEFTIKTKEEDSCTTSKLYFEGKNYNIYTYCLDSIKVVEDKKEKNLTAYLKKDINFLEDIYSKLDYTGLHSNHTTLVFKSMEDDEFTNNGLSIYKCHTEEMQDVYIGPKDMSFQSDFCTKKEIPKEEVVEEEKDS